jgi:YD repeat-containing protein
MTRRHWFVSLVAALAGAWSAARARAVPRPPSRVPGRPLRPARPWPAGRGCTSASYFYDASNRLVAVHDVAGTVTTYVYDGSGGRGGPGV